MQAPAVPPEKRPSVIRRDLIVQAHAFDGRGGGQHLLHARPAARAFVADNNHVAGLDLAVDNTFVRLRFRLEDNHRAGEFEHIRLDAGRFDDRALWGQVAVENYQPAFAAVGVFDFADAIVRIES